MNNTGLYEADRLPALDDGDLKAVIPYTSEQNKDRSVSETTL